VLHVRHGAPPFQIHQCIDGVLLDTTAPRGVPVPGTFADDAAELFGRLGQVPAGALPPLPLGWAADGDAPAFAQQLSDVTGGMWGRFRRGYGSLYDALGVPSDPLAPVLDGWAALTPRPFRLLHCDVHRKNVIIGHDGQAVFLDWELVLWGDPVYDIAIHLHKMTYVEAEERRLLDSWSSLLPAAATRAWESDLARYLVHERIKSVLVDTVRYTKLIADPTANPARRPKSLVRSLTTKLNAAGAVWGWARPTDEERVKQAVRDFLQEQA
jgi:aminoglycoside phosphotransferase (APT) family kinase protein